MNKSETLFQQASAVIPGGVNSPLRAFNGVGGTPPFIERAEGAYLIDVDGRAFRIYHGFGDSFGEGGIRGDQDRLRAFVMLSLAEKIKRDPIWIVVRVGDHQNLGRPGDHVDADLAKHAPLGGSDIGVAGAGDLVDGLDWPRAVGQRRDRLCAADPTERAFDVEEAKTRPARRLALLIGVNDYIDARDLRYAVADTMNRF